MCVTYIQYVYSCNVTAIAPLVNASYSKCTPLNILYAPETDSNQDSSNVGRNGGTKTVPQLRCRLGAGFREVER